MDIKLKILFLFFLISLFSVSCVDRKEKAFNLITEAKIKSDNSDFQGALADYNKSIEIDSTIGIAWFLRGNIKLSLRMFTEAISDYNKAIEFNNKNMDAYYNRGYTYFILGNKEKACENYYMAYKLGKPNIEDKIKDCKEVTE